MSVIQVLMRNTGRTVVVETETPVVAVEKSGVINSNETWSGLIHLTGDVDVASGVELTISAGTQVIAQGDFVLHGQGQIQALGTAQDKITFTCNTGVTASWYGVCCGKLNQVEPDASAVYIFNHCDFSKASKATVRGGVTWDYTLARGSALCAWLTESFTADNCTFTDCSSHGSGGSLYINGGSKGADYAITNCTFTNSSSVTGFGGGFKCDHGGTYTLTNNVFSNCSAGSSSWNDLAATVNSSTDFVSVGKQHYMKDGFTIKFISGVAPAPLSLNTEYFVISTSTGNSSFQLATTLQNSKNDVVINLTNTGSNPRVALFDNWMIFDAGYIIN